MNDSKIIACIADNQYDAERNLSIFKEENKEQIVNITEYKTEYGIYYFECLLSDGLTMRYIHKNEYIADLDIEYMMLLSKENITQDIFRRRETINLYDKLMCTINSIMNTTSSIPEEFRVLEYSF